MTLRSRPAPPLPPDSLAFALLHASTLVAAVLSGQALTDAFEKLWTRHLLWSPANRGAIQDLTYRTLRHFGRGDAWIRHLTQRPPALPIRALLLVALDRLEAAPAEAHVTVDQAVRAAEALRPAVKGMVNAVLRNVLRAKSIPDDDAVARHAHPGWWLARLRRDHPHGWQAIAAAGNTHPPMTLRPNRRRSGAEELARALTGAGLSFRDQSPFGLTLTRPIPVQRLPGFVEGAVSIQDAGAQRAAHWLDLAAGQRVLDACSAPGGKAAHILESVDVSLLALELDSHRAARIGENFQRLGLAGDIRVADAGEPDAWWDGRPFDRILADVPCSASGVVRRHPDIKWLRRDADIAGFAAQQARLLDALWPTLAVGGKMLYVTCSVFEEENRGQIRRFLARHPDAEGLPIDHEPDRQLLPNDDHDGFYFALLRKRS
ncbi:MAG: 16S rRNA (cytosine(967)-C(5))-methyltransferase RsmB [Zoogloeaceae bacterium]|nr:16S rRNA (cytosine(967)-C(5))-methyltransferase RsmB [Zoogloeaceae bacterium]